MRLRAGGGGAGRWCGDRYESLQSLAGIDDAVAAWLDGSVDPAPVARPRRCSNLPAPRRGRHGAILLPFRARRARSSKATVMTSLMLAATTAAETAHATGTMLEALAVMLGAALLFVLVVPQARPRRDAWLYRRRRDHRAAGARAGRRSRAARIESPKSASRCCCSSSGWNSIRADCGGCARTFSGSAWRRSCCAAWRSAGSSISRSGSRPGSRRWRSACRWPCRRPRRCCRCCAPTDCSTRRAASGPFRSCCSRTCRSSR